MTLDYAKAIVQVLIQDCISHHFQLNVLDLLHATGRTPQSSLFLFHENSLYNIWIATKNTFKMSPYTPF